MTLRSQGRFEASCTALSGIAGGGRAIRDLAPMIVLGDSRTTEAEYKPAQRYHSATTIDHA